MTSGPTKAADGTEFPGTCPTDVRYPNQNTTRYCYQMFIDYQRCTRVLGKSHQPCEYFKKCYEALCPFVWIAKWHEQLEMGAFPVDLPDDKEASNNKSHDEGDEGATSLISGTKAANGDGIEILRTCPTDVRYPNQNTTRYCYQMFIDYQRCTRVLGKSHKPCEYFKKCYETLCPFVWIAKWHEQLEMGAFPVDLPDDKGS